MISDPHTPNNQQHMFVLVMTLYPRQGFNILYCFVTGIAGTLAVIAYGIYGYKNRGPMSTSRYLLKFRVLAQGAVVCAMIIGATLSNKK